MNEWKNDKMKVYKWAATNKMKEWKLEWKNQSINQSINKYTAYPDSRYVYF